jgi:phytoene dehydrogenase-like protein
MARERWLVCGGGFKGLIGAYLLASRGKDVVLLERGPALGGNLCSVPWKGFHLDKGCHLFDNDDNATTSVVMEILGEDYEPVDVTYASVMNRSKTDGISVPHLGSLDGGTVRAIVEELVSAAARPEPACRSLRDKLEARFGPTAAGYLAGAVRKMYGIGAEEVDAGSLGVTPFERVQFLEGEAGESLKAHRGLRDRVAISSQGDPLRFYRHPGMRYSFRNFYPREHGLRRFCEKAEARLRAMGTDVRLGVEIRHLDAGTGAVSLVLAGGEVVEGDRVLWAGDLESLAEACGLGDGLHRFVHGVPMVMYYFVIEKRAEGEFTYLQDFDADDLLFRASVPGGYVRRSACPEGLSYVCVEVPTTPESPEWTDPKRFAGRVGEELRRYDVVCSDAPLETLTVPVPLTYRVPRIGYWEAVREAKDRLKREARVVFTGSWELGKNEIIRSLQAALREV